MEEYKNDKALRDGLHMLLLHTPQEDILQRWRSPERFGDKGPVPESFSNALPKVHPDRFSIDDAKAVRCVLNDAYHEGSMGVLEMIADFSEQALTLRDGHPFVRYEQVLRWRDTVHPLGTVPFICAFLATEDTRRIRERRMFSFNAVLPTDCPRLETVFNHGMAENHFHLKGSTPSFLLSWVYIMNNHLSDCRAELDSWDKKRRGTEYEHMDESLYLLVVKAAAIRLFLFSLLRDPKDKSLHALVREIIEARDELTCVSLTDRLQAEISSWREISGAPVQIGWQTDSLKPDGHGFTFCPDYALLYSTDNLDNSTYNLFAGEFYFQYSLFRKFFNKDKEFIPYTDLFYAYLAAGAKLREEIVQCNNQFGFQNFCEYDGRKSALIRCSPRFLAAQKYIALMTNLSDKRIEHLEARIVPDESATEISRQICEYNSLLDPAMLKNDRLVYILHIPKRNDTLHSEAVSCVTCRDAALRRHTRRVVSALIDLRNGSDPSALCIRGIDACANELYVRPEIFAPEFRRMKNHEPEKPPDREKSMPMVRVTYHVGEDFIDLVDGLRAIWEAMTFLELGRSDRMGHALALGIDVTQWYQQKQYRVFLPRQNLLDNCVWLMHVLSAGGRLDPQLAAELLSECTRQYEYIYEASMPYQENENNFNVTDYFRAMELRGDEPDCYCNYRSFEDYSRSLDSTKVDRPYALRSDDKGSPLYEMRRSNRKVIRLYFHYHYNPQVKKRGAETVEYHTSKRYVTAAAEAQRLLQRQIADKGIAIESNPSSNVLIGNFNRYERHPIVAFNDRGLFDNPDNPNLFASINTDDQGVFDTSLENEYALIARGLEQMTDDRDERVVSSDRIYVWLDNIREMGLEQVF